MPAKYRVCIIAPPGYIHSSCFLEVAWLLAASFSELGLECDAKLNEPDATRTNIILGGHLLTSTESLKGIRYVPYQLEQLSSNEGAWNENLRLLLKNASEVWDYSMENIAFLATKGITAKHVPVGYHKVLERIPDTQPKEADVLFYGSLGGRRKPLLDKLAAAGDCRVKAVFGVYGQERDAWISRSKIVLNIHYYDVKIFEAVRISYLINNRVFVLSEESAINPYPGVTIPMAPYNGIEDAVRTYLADEGLRDRIRMENYECFKEKYPMGKLVAHVLGM
jgi:hypothetical protein